MSANAATRLMHAVLDGEATPAEARELEGLLEADPALRERFGEWRAMFDAMQRMSRAYPPEGLVAAVMANIPHVPAAPGSQLSPHSRVIGVISDSHRAIPETSAPILRSPRAMAPPGGYMSDQQTNPSSKRKIWIGAGIAAIAVIVVGGYALDVPPASKDAVGTIVPAQRFVAPQNTAVDLAVRPRTEPGPGNDFRPRTEPLPAAGVAAGQAENQARAVASGQADNQARAVASGQAENQARAVASGQAENQARAAAEAQAASQAAGIAKK
jgi:anti-sigma factor RsiW